MDLCKGAEPDGICPKWFSSDFLLYYNCYMFYLDCKLTSYIFIGGYFIWNYLAVQVR